MVADDSPTVFKTVCGALLRRPGWVRFPSIPANLSGHMTVKTRVRAAGPMLSSTTPYREQRRVAYRARSPAPNSYDLLAER